MNYTLWLWLPVLTTDDDGNTSVAAEIPVEFTSYPQHIIMNKIQAIRTSETIYFCGRMVGSNA